MIKKGPIRCKTDHSNVMDADNPIPEASERPAVPTPSNAIHTLYKNLLAGKIIFLDKHYKAILHNR